MTFPEDENLSWIDAKHCSKCGRGPEFFITKHHQKVHGQRTGFVTFLCRDCHNLAEGSPARKIIRIILDHLPSCDVTCWANIEVIMRHADVAVPPPWVLHGPTSKKEAAHLMGVDARQKMAVHLSDCNSCYLLFDAVRDHAGIPQRPVHRRPPPWTWPPPRSASAILRESE